jgi:hypothetical protein
VRTVLGAFAFNHMASRLSFAYALTEVAPRQLAFVASPEKALLDLVYLTPRGDSPGYLRELRLQHPEAIRPAVLLELAMRSRKPKLRRAAQHAITLLTNGRGEVL